VLKQDSASPVRVILTMRSEFLGECARLPGLAAVVNTAQYLLPHMDTASLRRAIRRPAELYGGSVTIELADRLIADVQGSQDELPLIQHGLMRMWDLAGEAAPGKQAPRRLDLPLYEAHGPLARLLDGHAEAVALAAAPDESGRRVVENLFRALSDINADGHAIRRPQTVQSLMAVTGAERGRLISILDAFRSDGVSFLTPYAPAGLDKETMIDVSHEALIRCWNSLAAAPDGWLHREFCDGLIWQSLLSQAEIFEKDPRKVLGPATTEDRESWLKDRTPAWSERYGGGWSRVEQLVTASRSAADRQRRRDRLMTRTLSIVTVVLLGALAVAGLLWQVAEERKTNADKMRYLAEEQRKVAEEQRKVAEEQGGQADDILSSATNIIVKLQTTMDDDIKKEAFLIFTRGAEHGDSSSMRNLGVSYRDALGIAQDYVKAREWYEKAVAKGNTYAMVDLGLLYAHGRGVTQDYVRAREWYEKAVAKDNTDAMVNLGLLYANGQGVAQDHAIAREWYEKAAEKGEETAMFNLGLLYEKGQGVTHDYIRAREWYEKAADKDLASAMVNLGVLYANGQGVTRDYIRAREWYEKAAEKGEEPAMFNLGLLYENGQGVTQDYIRAREWYEKAAANDHAAAMRNLGLLYENGQSVTQDYVKAREWYEKAVAKSNTDAMVDLGLLYENGQGVTQDYIRAREW
jgi:TPR repeat protein